MKPIKKPTEEALTSSIRNNIRFYYVALFAWVGFLLYGVATKDGYLWLASIMFLVAACYFGLGQKIDKARLELMLK